MGKPRYLWGDGLRGKPLNRMGNRENVWEMPQDIGNGAGVLEAARPYGEQKSHEKQNMETDGGLWTLRVFVNFGRRRRPGMGAARLYGKPARMADLA